MIKFGTARKAIAILANVSLLFNSFVPFLLVAQPAYAQSSEVVAPTIEYSQSANKININVNTSEKVAYQLFYKTDKIDAIAGNDLALGNFYLGTCSASVCLPQNISRGILKIESGSEFHSQFFTLENNVLTVIKESDSSQSDLTNEENDFLENISQWTFEKVELNKEYVAPQNSGVKLTFTKLPENSGNIKIEEITLTPEQIEQSGSLSDKAYDITSDMVDGTFVYNLSLPIPESAKGQNVDIKFAEEISQINSAQAADNTTETNTVVSATNLDHFTIFIVTNPALTDAACISAGGSNISSCYSTIQAAIDAANIGDNINLQTDLTTSSQINLNKAITLEGNGHTISPNFIKNGSSNNSVITVRASNVTIKNLKINGVNGTSLIGINLYLVNNVYFDSVTIINNDNYGIIINGSTLTVNNLTTSGNTVSGGLFSRGINIDLGSGVTGPAVLTVNGVSHHSESTAIYMDNYTKNVSVIDTNNQYKYTNFFNSRTYKFVSDTTAPTATISYNTINPTNQPVIATLNPSEAVTVTNNSGLTTYTFNQNGSFIFQFKDATGNTGSATATVNNINTVVPIITIGTYTTAPTNQDITVTASTDKGTLNIGSTIFTSNGSFIFTATDSAGNSTSKTVTIDNIDKTVPNVPQHLSPSNNVFINYNDFWFDWTDVGDAVSYEMQNSTNPVVDINGSFVNVMWTGDYQKIQPIASTTRSVGANGTWYWQVRAVDAAGNKSAWTTPWQINIDQVAPSVPTGIYYKDTVNNKIINCGDKTNTKHLDVYWNKNTETDFDHYEYVSYNADGSTGPIRTFTDNYFIASWWTIPSEGIYGVQIRTVDKAGNKSDWFGGLQGVNNSCKYIVDWTKPIITLGSYITTPTNQDITVTATTNEGTLNTTSHTFTTNGSFDFIATDSAENVTTKTVTITNIDKEKPTTPQSMDFKNPNLSCGSITNQKNITIDWSDSSDNIGVVGYDYSIDYPNGVTRGKWNTFFTQSQYRGSLNEGIHYIQIRAKDAAGNVSDWTNLCNITYDSIAPIITVNPFITNNKTPTLTGTVNDNTATVSVKVNNADYIATNNNGIWSIVTSTLADSTYDVIASATDAAGNVGTDSTTNELTVDSIAPTATYKHYIGETEFTGSIAYVNSLSKLSFTGEYLDATPSSGLLKDSYVIFDAQADHSFKFAQNGAKSYCSWRTEPNLVDGLSGTNFSLTNKESFTNCISDLGEGEYYMTHQVYDNAIRQDIPSITQFRDVLGLHFIVDKNAPTLLDKTIFEDIWYNTDQTSTFNFTDKNEIVSGNNPTCTINTEGTQQTCSVDLNVCDVAGNCNTETIISNGVNIDKTNPTVTASINPVSPDGKNGWYWTQPEITLVGSDTNLYKVEYQWDSQIEGSWTTYSSAIKPLTEGNHDLYYRAIDKAGNVSTIGSKNIRWDKTDLEYGPQNLSANPNPTSGSTSKIKWEMGKDNTGIDKYEIQWKLDDSHSYSKTVGAGTTEVEIDQLIEGRWTVKVIAFDQSGRTKDNSIDLIVDRTGPVAPTLQITSTGTGTVSLAWNAISDAKDYIIWYGSVQGVHEFGARVGNVTSYTVRGLGAGNYYFIIKAVDEAQNQSSDSNEVNTGNITGAAGTNPGQPAEGFSEQVLGANTEEITPTATPAIELGDVLGSSITKEISNWWWLLLLAIIPLYVVGKKISKKKK